MANPTIPGSPNAQIQDRIKGVLFGHAIGDALGVGAKFLSKQEVGQIYPNGLREISDIILQDHTRRWRKGDFTEATGHMLCTLDALAANDGIQSETLARLLLERFGNDGARGMKKVFAFRVFRTDPLRAARQALEKSGGRFEDNGALFRAPAIGVWNLENLEKTRENSRLACLVTHASDSCVADCIAISCAIAALINGSTVEEAIRTADELTGGRLGGFFSKGIDAPFSESPLPEESSARTSTLAFHVLKHAGSFQEGLEAVIREGGDSTGNGAVAGALLGARFGFSGIGANLIQQLRGGSEIEERLQGRFKGSPSLPGEGEMVHLGPGDHFSPGGCMNLPPMRFLFALNRGFTAIVRWCACFVVKLVSLLTGWITEDTFYVVNDELGEEVVEFMGGPKRDTWILRVLVFFVLAFAIIQIWLVFLNAFGGFPRLNLQDVGGAFSHATQSTTAREPRLEAGVRRDPSSPREENRASGSVFVTGKGPATIFGRRATPECFNQGSTKDREDRCRVCGALLWFFPFETRVSHHPSHQGSNHSGQ